MTRLYVSLWALAEVAVLDAKNRRGARPAGKPRSTRARCCSPRPAKSSTSPTPARNSVSVIEVESGRTLENFDRRDGRRCAARLDAQFARAHP
jgi:hypothetical protein